MASSDDWKSPGFRQNVAARIEEAIRQSGNPTPKTASEMETHFFQRATNKEEYLSYLARLLIHIKELGSKHRTQGVPGQANPQQQQGNLPQGQMMNQMNNVRPQQQLNMLLDQQQKNVMVPNQQQQQMNQQQMVSNQHQQMNQMNANPQQQQMNPMGSANPQQQMNQMAPNSQQMNQMAPNPQQQQMNQMAPNPQQMNQMAPNQQQMNPMASNPQQQQQMNTMASNPQQQQQINQMNVNQQQQMNQMGGNQQMNQQQMMGNQQQQQIGMNQGMNQFNPNSNMNVGNPLMQQLGTPNQQIGNNPGSALLSQLNQSQQQAMAGPMNAGMQRARFPVPAGAVSAGNKLIPPQQQQQQQQVQQQQLLNQQLMMQRKQQNEMVNQGPGTPQFVTGPGVPSPAMQQGPMSSGMGGAHMGAPSPAYVHSPGNVQLVNSPATAARMAGPQQQQRGVGGHLPPPSPSMMNVPTPGGMLHTPQGAGMGGGIQGPASMGGMNMSGGGGTGVMNEDQLYLDKVRQLSRFIEPLTRLISRFGDEDSEKLSKMKIMLDILSNPNKRMPMDTLLKCEAVLEKMDFKRSETGSVAPPSVASVPSLGVAVPAAKDQPPASGLHPLLETIANQAKSPYINHTLQRTFAPSVNALIGCDIAPPSLKRRHSDRDQDADDASDELMDTIEREIANMDPRFQVDLNQLHLLGSQDVHLTCRLDDKCLPFVPPLRIVIPREYPRTAPICDSQQQDYESSPFTRSVLKGLNDRLRHMPQRYSVSQVLNCWEMALRHACKPNSNPHGEIPPLIAAFGL